MLERVQRIYKVLDPISIRDMSQGVAQESLLPLRYKVLDPNSHFRVLLRILCSFLPQESTSSGVLLFFASSAFCLSVLCSTDIQNWSV